VDLLGHLVPDMMIASKRPPSCLLIDEPLHDTRDELRVIISLLI
jgi:hypothetical protein